MEEYGNQLIIFSKNRACQLHLLLESIIDNALELFDTISVLYKSENDYFLGYELLKNDFKDYNFNFFEEKNFRNDLFNLIDDEIETITFMVDDAILFEKVTTKKNKILKSIISNNEIFSLRLGKNCIYSHPANKFYKINEHETIDEFIIFDYTKQEIGDFKYPLSTDGHIFNTKLIKNLLDNINFKNPNELESNLQIFVLNNSIPKNIRSFIHSKLVSVPINLVNTTFKNRYGLEYYVSEMELEKTYVSGKKIDFKSLNFDKINGPHKEIKYNFKNK